MNKLAEKMRISLGRLVQTAPLMRTERLQFGGTPLQDEPNRSIPHKVVQMKVRCMKNVASRTYVSVIFQGWFAGRGLAEALA
jgi:hypothetical protein